MKKYFEGKLLIFNDDPTEVIYELHSYGENETILISEMDIIRCKLFFVPISMVNFHFY